MHFGTDFGVGFGRREGFGARIGREAMSAQDIGFRGVAGGVKECDVFEVILDGLTDGVSINVGSLDEGVAGGLEAICGGVAGGVSTASGVDVFGVGLAFGVCSASTQGQVGE